MNGKAVAKCSNGHEFQWGQCKAQKQKLFGGTKKCGSRLFEQIYDDGSKQTVSFDDRRWNAVQCVSCHTLYKSTMCPECGVEVPVSAFEKKGFLSKLG